VMHLKVFISVDLDRCLVIDGCFRSCFDVDHYRSHAGFIYPYFAHVFVSPNYIAHVAGYHG